MEDTKPIQTPDEAFGEAISSIDMWLRSYIWISFPNRFNPGLHSTDPWDTYDDERPRRIARMERALEATKRLLPTLHKLFEPMAAEYRLREAEMYDFVAANRSNRPELMRRYPQFIAVGSDFTSRTAKLLERRSEYVRE